MGFCDGWIRRIMLCVTLLRYLFRINDEIIGPISPGRGIQQGDPLSPYLFILRAEGLSVLLKRANREGKLHGRKASRNGPVISHLMIAFYFVELIPSKLRLSRMFYLCMRIFRGRLSIMESRALSSAQHPGGH